MTGRRGRLYVWSNWIELRIATSISVKVVLNQLGDG
jgi:hypothetical protein